MAKKKVLEQLECPVPEEEQGSFKEHIVYKKVPTSQLEQYHKNPAEYWNKFYQKNENKFFKDRNWLRIEFPELFSTSEAGAGKKRVFEIGCGAGNTMFPLLDQCENPELFVYAADYSKTAVEVVQSNRNYDTSRSLAFVWDLSSSDIPSEIEPESLDIIVLVFVLSALAPEQWEQAIKNIHKV